VRAFLLTLGVMVSSPAAAHCYAIWHYPYPQHCGGSYVRHQIRASIYRVRSDPAPRVLVLNVHNNVGMNFKLPALNDDLAWDMPLETKEQLELYEGIQRVKAILLLPHGE
jgi:hypothetical protein